MLPNERLARKRATDFRNYVDSRYRLSASYPVTVSAVVDEWRAAVPAVEASSIPSKQEVLQILNGSDKATVKEMRLKRLPAAWNYMRQHILPPMRHVEMAFTYDKSSVVTERTPIPLPEVEPVIHATYIACRRSARRSDYRYGRVRLHRARCSPSVSGGRFPPCSSTPSPRSDRSPGSPAGGSGDSCGKKSSGEVAIVGGFIIFTPNIKLSGLLWQI